MDTGGEGFDDEEVEDISLVFSLHHEYAVVLIQQRWRNRNRVRQEAQAALHAARRQNSLQA